MTWQHLDTQMKHWSSRLVTDVKLLPKVVSCLATTIAADILSLPIEDEMRQATPVPLERRREEIAAFDSFAKLTQKTQAPPPIQHGVFITANYLCFIYLPESCFRIVAKAAPAGSSAKKCAKFLSDNPIRAFRNSLAHGNWIFKDDYSGIVYWARKGADKNEPIVRYEVDQESLYFWQQLALCVAYVIFSDI
jgi:hypothetical protein